MHCKKQKEYPCCACIFLLSLHPAVLQKIKQPLYAGAGKDDHVSIYKFLLQMLLKCIGKTQIAEFFVIVPRRREPRVASEQPIHTQQPAENAGRHMELTQELCLLKIAELFSESHDIPSFFYIISAFSF